MRKLVEDRLEFEAECELDPRALRSELFEAAACQRRALGPGEQLDRDAFLAVEAPAAACRRRACCARCTPTCAMPRW